MWKPVTSGKPIVPKLPSNKRPETENFHEVLQQAIDRDKLKIFNSLCVALRLSASKMSAVEHVSGIPVVDFGAMSLEHDIRPNTDSQAVQTLSKQIYSAFSTIGFVYLKNHGIHQQKVGFSFNVCNTSW